MKEVGIVFCSEQNDAMARVTPPENDEQILAAERALRLATNVKGPSDGKG